MADSLLVVAGGAVLLVSLANGRNGIYAVPPVRATGNRYEQCDRGLIQRP
jgi:hypothetical protein